MFLTLILIFCFCDVFVCADYGLDRFPRLKTLFDCSIRLSPLEEPYAIIPAHTIVIEEHRKNFNDISYVWVSVPAIVNFGRPLVGWIKKDELQELALKVENDFKKNEEKRYQSEYETKLLEINKVCENNEKFDKKKRLPEPYFARAKLYEQNGEYANAMMDYLEGLNYVQNQFPSGYQYVPYEKYFDEIKKSVETALNCPCTVTGLGCCEIDTVGRYFSQGYTHFWDHKFEEALNDFNNAISRRGNVPIYWYYRGLTYWNLGSQNKATYNFLMASIMEKNSVKKENEIAQATNQGKNQNSKRSWEDKYPLQIEVSEYLSRFQGKDRMFLEKIRWGDPSNLILKTFLDEIDKKK